MGTVARTRRSFYHYRSGGLRACARLTRSLARAQQQLFQLGTGTYSFAEYAATAVSNSPSNVRTAPYATIFLQSTSDVGVRPGGSVE
jgi:hypothetical protein